MEILRPKSGSGKFSNEVSKAGIEPVCLFDFLKKVRYIEWLPIVGLIAIPRVVAEAGKLVPVLGTFRTFYQTQTEIFSDGPDFYEISMGKSKDFEVAIEGGDNW